MKCIVQWANESGRELAVTISPNGEALFQVRAVTVGLNGIETRVVDSVTLSPGRSRMLYKLLDEHFQGTV